MITHEEIISHIQAQRNKLNIKDMAKEIGISYQYLNDVIKQRAVKGKVRKLNEKLFPKIIAYLNDLTIWKKQRGKLGSILKVGQVEGITFINNTDGFISNEKFKVPIFKVKQGLRKYAWKSCGLKN